MRNVPHNEPPRPIRGHAMSKVIWTHVTDAALRGIMRLSEGREVYLWPTPYVGGDGKTRWTVVTKRTRRAKTPSQSEGA
jgi:hypothetical protein